MGHGRLVGSWRHGRHELARRVTRVFWHEFARLGPATLNVDEREGQRSVIVAKGVDHPARFGWSDAWYQLEQTEPRHFVAWIVREAKGGEQILHVRGL